MELKKSRQFLTHPNLFCQKLRLRERTTAPNSVHNLAVKKGFLFIPLIAFSPPHLPPISPRNKATLDDPLPTPPIFSFTIEEGV